MAVMVFKRAVFETRKKPKGMLKPKQQANVKEIAQVLICVRIVTITEAESRGPILKSS